MDYGDAFDLKIRLQVLAAEADRRLVTVFGSGISSAVLPDVKELTELFRDQIPPAALNRFDEVVGPILGTPLGYQNAAALLTRQVSEKAVMHAIRLAVLRASLDVSKEDVERTAANEAKCREYAQSGSWDIPEGYRRFARFFASLDGSVRGPIITTNFDPLIEVALREAGIGARAIPVPVDSVPTPGQLVEDPQQPVLHIHGYWTDRATSNIHSRINADRPQLDRVLQKILRNSVVLVIGYSGWLDGFMKSLRSRILNDAELLETDVLWASYDATPDSFTTNDDLKSMVSAPGFNLYLGVDGHKLFGAEEVETSAPADVLPSPFGYRRVVPLPVVEQPTSVHFADGGQPSWADAEPGTWPALASTELLEGKLLTWLDSGGGGGVAAVGPLGEGKSLAIRQVAAKLARTRPDWNVFWREPGAAPITEAWLHEVQDAFGKVLICADEADLLIDQLAATGSNWGTEGSGLAFLLASHDRLWAPASRHTKLRHNMETVLFHGITHEDAMRIAEAWLRLGIMPVTSDGLSDAVSVANRLTASAGSMAAGSNTLFGAVLDVRYGDHLEGRVKDLLEKLRQVKLTGDVNLGDVFAAVCIMQDVMDRDGSRRKGASRPVMAAMVGLDAVFADGKILETLGREAAVAFAGNRVYSRHPAIASAVVNCVHKDGTAEKVYKLVGRAGGTLMRSGGWEVEGFRDAYLFSRSLEVPEAIWAAQGVVEGAGRWQLETRVTLLAALRRQKSASAVAYARKLAPELRDYNDFYGAVRAYLVDFSIALRLEGHAQTSAGIASLALDDRVGYTLDISRADYALVSLAKSSQKLEEQTKGGPIVGAPEICFVLLERIRGEAEARSRLTAIYDSLDKLDDFRAESSSNLCGRLASVLAQAAKAAVLETNLDLELDGRLSFATLRELTAAANPRL